MSNPLWMELSLLLEIPKVLKDLAIDPWTRSELWSKMKLPQIHLLSKRSRRRPMLLFPSLSSQVQFRWTSWGFRSNFGHVWKGSRFGELSLKKATDYNRLWLFLGSVRAESVCPQVNTRVALVAIQEKVAIQKKEWRFFLNKFYYTLMAFFGATDILMAPSD